MICFVFVFIKTCGFNFKVLRLRKKCFALRSVLINFLLILFFNGKVQWVKHNHRWQYLLITGSSQFYVKTINLNKTQYHIPGQVVTSSE